MKKTELYFILTRPARSCGGDRYESAIEGEDRPLVIYVPQTISRPKGSTPVQNLKVSFEVEEG